MSRPRHTAALGVLILALEFCPTAALRAEFSPPAADQTLDVETELDSARRALESSRLDQAEQGYRRLIAYDPGFADAYQGLARVLVARGLRAEAVALLLQAGKGLIEARDMTAGKAFLEEAVAVDPASAAAHLALGHAYLVDNEFPQAVIHLQRAIELGEHGLTAGIYLGSALWENGQLEAAENVYRETLERHPNHALTQRSLGGLLLWQGRYAEAVPLLQRAAAQSFSSPELQYDLASALAGAGQVETALEAYRRTIELAPDLAQAHYGYAVLLARSGKREPAARELAEFRRLQAQAAEKTDQEYLRNARLNYGWNLLSEGKAAEAVQYFESLPPSRDRLVGLAKALSATGDHRRAIGALEQALLLSPGDRSIEMRLLDERLAAEE